jgi:hypothetical protein
MRRLLAFQILADLIVLSVIAMAEVAALLLAHFPASALLWYINQDVFGFMEVARESPASSIFPVIRQTTLYWDLGLAFAVLLMYRLRWRFGAALISHACLIFVGLLAFDWAVATKLPRTASLKPVIAVFGQPNGAVLLLACGAALLSAILAHLTYLAGSRSIWLGQTHERIAHSHRPGGGSDICDPRRSSKLSNPE